MTKSKDTSADVVDLATAKKAKSAGKKAKCPICGKPVQGEYTPFCSKRCADVDLGKWLGEGYRIPTDEVQGFDDGYGEDD